VTRIVRQVNWNISKKKSQDSGWQFAILQYNARIRSVFISDPIVSICDVAQEMKISLPTVVHILTIHLRYYSWKYRLIFHMLTWWQRVERFGKFWMLFITLVKAKKCVWYFLLTGEQFEFFLCWTFLDLISSWRWYPGNDEVIHQYSQIHTYNLLEYKRNLCYWLYPRPWYFDGIRFINHIFIWITHRNTSQNLLFNKYHPCQSGLLPIPSSGRKVHAPARSDEDAQNFYR
jgi:hypothetical protein